MYIFITILIIIIAIFLGLVVLIQNPKGGGVNSTFGGASQQIFGAARTTDVVEKTTWTLGILLLVFCLFSAFFLGKTTTAVAAGQGQGKAATTTTTGPETEADRIAKRANETGSSRVAPMPTQQQAPPQGQQAPAQQQPAQPAK